MNEQLVRSRRGQQGFTLVELVVTLIVASILVAGTTSFMLDSVRAYMDTQRRSNLAGAARAALYGMSEELRNALPNSLRIAAGAGSQCLEFLPVQYTTKYVDAPFAASGTAIEAVALSLPPQPGALAGLQAIIAPLDAGELYGTGQPGARAGVNSASDSAPGDGRISLQLSAAHQFIRSSPAERLYLAEQPISYCLSGDRLYRYQDYGITAVQCLPQSCLPTSAPNRTLLSSELDPSQPGGFLVAGATLQRNAIVSLSLNFRAEDESLQLGHEILVRNVP